MKRRLYRSRTNRMLGGVCGGLGEFLDIDATWVRIIFVLLALLGGLGIILYLIMWLIVPVEGEEKAPKELVRQGAEEIVKQARVLEEETKSVIKRAGAPASMIIGAVLVALGVLFLLENLGLLWILWPALLILGGLFLFVRRGREELR